MKFRYQHPVCCLSPLDKIGQMKRRSFCSTATLNYRYDYLNRLVSRTVDQTDLTDNRITAPTVAPTNPDNLTVPQPTRSTHTVEHFIHDGNQIVLQLENNELAQRNFWGTEINELIAVDNLIDEETLWILADHLNSTRKILRNENNNVQTIASIDYDAFGNITEDENPVNLSYTGKYHDNITGLQWNINRWYDSTTGQWISEDPIGFNGGDTNLHRYVGNNVINKFDKNGLDEIPSEYKGYALDELKEMEKALKKRMNESREPALKKKLSEELMKVKKTKK